MLTSFPYKLIDLTHALSPAIPTWDGSCGFDHRRHSDYDPGVEYQFRIHRVVMNEGIGTHMDSPAHCIPGASTIDRLSLENLAVPCVVIDVSATADMRYKVSPEDIMNFEKTHGSIPAGSLVMVKTGWERFWQKPEQYRNDHLFPSVSPEAAQLLLARDIAGLGTDTLSSDRGDEGFPVHKLILGAGKYLVENAANLSSLPPTGSFVMTMPLKIKDGTEAPVRLIGLIGTHLAR